MRSAAAIAFFAAVALGQSDRPKIYTVTAVRTWSLADATRVAIEVSGPFEYKYDRLHNPERVYFDIKGALPSVEGRRLWNKEIADKLVQRIRVAETNPAVTRVVLDVSGTVDVSPSQLTNPNRLMIELRASASAPPATVEETAPVLRPLSPPASPQAALDIQKAAVESAKSAEPKTKLPMEPVAVHRTTAPSTALPTTPSNAPQFAVEILKSAVESPKTAEPKPKPPVEPVADHLAAMPEPPRDVVKPPVVKAETAISPAELARAARPTSGGTSSLTRALGLKLNRIVLDAGHGGHDQGTAGSKGLLEKDLVLDVTLRLGKLIEEGMGAEVIYTRSDDTFVPLEGRTAIANEKKADLFLSIHANASSFARVTGVECYYLNFTDSKEAMELAGRENATAQHSIFDLETLTHKITLHEKLDESREFASRMQSALFAFSARSFPAQKNRGVRKAPFVVLIGASMPSVLVEIGFVSNAREEQLLKRPEYRQKLAESLYKGMSKYAESLSHFQLAQSR